MTPLEIILIAIIVSFLVDNWGKLRWIAEEEEKWEEKHKLL